MSRQQHPTAECCLFDRVEMLWYYVFYPEATDYQLFTETLVCVSQTQIKEYIMTCVRNCRMTANCSAQSS